MQLRTDHLHLPLCLPCLSPCSARLWSCLSFPEAMWPSLRGPASSCSFPKQPSQREHVREHCNNTNYQHHTCCLRIHSTRHTRCRLKPRDFNEEKTQQNPSLDPFSRLHWSVSTKDAVKCQQTSQFSLYVLSLQFMSWSCFRESKHWILYQNSKKITHTFKSNKIMFCHFIADICSVPEDMTSNQTK